MNGHFISNTHLDREWTMDFQHTRKLTVEFLNDLLEIMERIPGYTFLLDSQAVPIEDYLEIMPENRERLGALIRAGRIDAGPWYSALDMNCLCGESIVRNLLYGHLTVEAFGPVMKVGYTPFGWGQMSQLPQIYRGFGIDVAFFYRGITAKETPRSEFIWEGADGSELLTSRFGTGARYNFYFDVWRKGFYSDLPQRLNRRFHWLEDAAPFKLCDEAHRYNHGSVFAESRPLDAERVREAFRDLLEREQEHFSVGEIAFMHGMDTSSPDIREDEILRECRKHLREGETLEYSSLPRYAAAIRDQTRGMKLARVTGEVRHLKMNEFGFSYIANDIVSARARQKTLTAEVESKLVRQAEPFAAMALLAGVTWPGKYLDLAWKQFLKCHPHDTIGGCGIDRLEEDATYRLRDTMSLAMLVSSESLMAIQSRIDTSSIGTGAVVLTVFNPMLTPRTEVVKAYVDVPRELPYDGFAMIDHTGCEAAFSIAPTNHRFKVFRDRADLALMSTTDEYRLHFEAAAVPALGYKTFILKPGAQQAEAAEAPGDANEFILENEHLHAEVREDGTVDLLDKATGQRFVGLNRFEDGGEIGHVWSHVTPIEDWVVSSRGVVAVRTREMASPVVASVKAAFALRIPATMALSADRQDWRQSARKQEDLRELPVEVVYTLRKGARSLEVSLSVDNQCRNHRLRALFPTGIQADASYAEAPFDVVRRAAVRGEKNPYSHFPELTFPMVRFAGVSDGARHFAVVSGGLKEYEALEDSDRTFALTIFRAYENRLCTSGDFDLEHRPGDLSQSIGRHTCEYRIFVGQPGSDHAALFTEADAMHAPMIVAETKARRGDLPMECSLAALDNPKLVFSAIKQAARSEALIVRLFNPGAEAQSGTLTFASPIRDALYTDLNEEPVAARPQFEDRCVRITAEPKKIVTLEVFFEAATRPTRVLAEN